MHVNLNRVPGIDWETSMHCSVLEVKSVPPYSLWTTGDLTCTKRAQFFCGSVERSRTKSRLSEGNKTSDEDGKSFGVTIICPKEILPCVCTPSENMSVGREEPCWRRMICSLWFWHHNQPKTSGEKISHLLTNLALLRESHFRDCQGTFTNQIEIGQPSIDWLY